MQCLSVYSKSELQSFLSADSGVMSCVAEAAAISCDVSWADHNHCSKQTCNNVVEKITKECHLNQALE